MKNGQGDSYYTFKIAKEESEFRQIHRLNYATFVKEIPQHEENPDGVLIDKFHEENTYLICLKGKDLMGMLALRDQRPFSLDSKLPDLDENLPPDSRIVEIRLLSVVPTARTGRVLQGLLGMLAELNQTKHWNLGIISGTPRQAKLYQRIGFQSFGPLVGSEEAPYQPMYISLEDFEGNTIHRGSGDPAAVHSFLPGPVKIPSPVREAFAEPPISHRLPEYRALLRGCQTRLCQLVKAKHAVITPGSGTIANDMVAAQLRELGEHGLILSNGEFGERLIEQGSRAGLSFDVLEHPWGEVLDIVRIEREIELENYDWVWMVACETSTGIVNDLEQIKSLCSSRGIKMCADCVSAIGAYRLDLGGLYLASGSSGKALGAFAGLSLVFHERSISPGETTPVSFDIGYYHACDGVPFTQSSNLLSALNAALFRFEAGDPFSDVRACSELLHQRLAELELAPLVDPSLASPAVVTIPLPESINSLAFGGLMQKRGFLIACRSNYLVERNWIQICLMGDVTLVDVDILIDALSVALI